MQCEYFYIFSVASTLPLYINLFEKRMLFFDRWHLGVKRSHKLTSEIAYKFDFYYNVNELRTLSWFDHMTNKIYISIDIQKWYLSCWINQIFLYQNVKYGSNSHFHLKSRMKLLKLEHRYYHSLYLFPFWVFFYKWTRLPLLKKGGYSFYSFPFRVFRFL